MAVSAYILIQTEVGKAAQVAEEVGGIDGVVSAEDGLAAVELAERFQQVSSPVMAKAVEDFRAAGFTNVISVEGGTAAWERAGRT